jgi:hypothetical protein
MSFIRNGRYYTDLEDSILPSGCTEDWLQFINPDDNIYRNSIYTGKWMLFIPDLNEHDKQWPILKQAINSGLLGISMKASTSISTIAMPRQADRLKWLRSCTTQPASSSMRSIFCRARSSGLWDMAFPLSSSFRR